MVPGSSPSLQRILKISKILIVSGMILICPVLSAAGDTRGGVESSSVLMLSFQLI